MQWPPDDEHMCSKHVEAWNKLIVKQKFCASSWLITEIKKNEDTSWWSQAQTRGLVKCILRKVVVACELDKIWLQGTNDSLL